MADTLVSPVSEPEHYATTAATATVKPGTASPHASEMAKTGSSVVLATPVLATPTQGSSLSLLSAAAVRPAPKNVVGARVTFAVPIISTTTSNPSEPPTPVTPEDGPKLDGATKAGLLAPASASSSSPSAAAQQRPLEAFEPNTPVIKRRQQEKQRVARVPWQQEHDVLLKANVDSLGVGAWPEIAKRLNAAAPHLPQRTGKQCRERWHNHLSPTVSRSDFTPEEDEAISKAVIEQGTKWADIVKAFPGRTDNAIKNRWNSMRRKSVRAEAREVRVAERALARLNAGGKKRRRKSTESGDAPPPRVSKKRKSTESGDAPPPRVSKKRKAADLRAADVLSMWAAAADALEKDGGGSSAAVCGEAAPAEVKRGPEREVRGSVEMEAEQAEEHDDEMALAAEEDVEERANHGNEAEKEDEKVDDEEVEEEEEDDEEVYAEHYEEEGTDGEALPDDDQSLIRADEDPAGVGAPGAGAPGAGGPGADDRDGEASSQTPGHADAAILLLCSHSPPLSSRSSSSIGSIEGADGFPRRLLLPRAEDPDQGGDSPETPGDPPPPGATLDSIVLGAPLVVTGQSCAALAECAAAREKAARDAALHGLLMSCDATPSAATASLSVSLHVAPATAVAMDTTPGTTPSGANSLHVGTRGVVRSLPAGIGDHRCGA
jgi:hypothetical protein